jgi:DNA-directed RNA polymerase subunit F
MIKEMTQISMAEAEKIVEKDSEVAKFIKKFTKIKAGEAEKLRRDIESLELLKVKKEHIAKIIEILPEDVVDLNKIFVDVGLDEDETNKLLEVIKNYR